MYQAAEIERHIQRTRDEQHTERYFNDNQDRSAADLLPGLCGCPPLRKRRCVILPNEMQRRDGAEEYPGRECKQGSESENLPSRCTLAGCTNPLGQAASGI